MQEQSQTLARQKADECLAEVKAGQSLEQLAQALNTQIEQTGLFSRKRAIPKLGRPQDFIREVFRMSVGEARVIDLLDQPAVVVLVEHKEFDAEGYEKDKAQVKQQVLRQKRDQIFPSGLTSFVDRRKKVTRSLSIRVSWRYSNKTTRRRGVRFLWQYRVKEGSQAHAMVRESCCLRQFLQQSDGVLRQRAFLSYKKMIGVRENGQALRFGNILHHASNHFRWCNGITIAAEKDLGSTTRL